MAFPKAYIFALIGFDILPVVLLDKSFDFL